jgi:hypothetical protein
MSIMRVRFTISGLEGLPGVHTTYWKGASSTPLDADCADVCGRVRAFWDTIKGSLAAGVIIVAPQSADLLNEATGELVGAVQPGAIAQVAGTGTSSLPSATMQLLRLNTTTVVNKRRLQGRSFIGPLGTAVNVGGNVQASANTLLLTGAANFNTGATASALQVWHRPTELVPAGGQVAAVTSYGVAVEFAILRSRRN